MTKVGEWGGEENKKHAVVWYLKAINGGNVYKLCII